MPPPNLPPSNPDIATLLQTIQSERRNLEGARAVMRAVQASSRNEAVIQQAQNEVRSAQVTIDFLEAELARLQMGAGAAPPAPGPPAAGPSSQQQQQQQQYGYNGQLPSQYHAPPRAGPDGPTAPLNINRADRERPLPPPPADDAQAPARTDKKTSQLDLLRYDAPLSGAKITRMLNQLNFKLQVEEQYKTGIEKMANAYRAEGDRRLRNETDAKRIESDGKIQLLRVAKKRYEKLAKFGSAVEEDEDLIPDSKRKEALRKPISGELVISLRGARELNHRPLPRRSSKAYSETYVAIKVEGTERAVSNLSRNDRWLEDFRIPVEKANEVEITIYDTVAPGDTAPIGMLWLRVSDLLEALRRQKVAAAENTGEGWVTADKAASMGTRQGSAPDSATLHQTGVHRPQGGQPGEQKSEGIDGWWSVEPAGAISLRLDFVKDSAAGGRRPYEALGRQGAVRKRKGDVHEMNGHKFVQRQFYQPIKCALCEEFLLTGEGYQCEDCRYACHKKCYPKVVTKCVSKSDMDGEGDEEKINHRIPHRFQPYTNMSANWCCHCGYMLPFGRKNSVKCTECDITCHQTCSRLVPDFCGMTMEMANTLLKNLRDIKTTQGTKKPATTYTHSHQPSITYTPPKQEQTPPARPPPPPDAFLPPQESRPSGQLPHSQSYNDYASIPQAPSSPARPPRPSSATQQQQTAPHRLSFDGRDQQRPNLEINTNVGPSSRPQQPPRVSTSPQPPPQQQQQQQPQQQQQQYQPPTQQRPQPAAGGYKPPASMPGLTQTPTSTPGRPAPPQVQAPPQQELVPTKQAQPPAVRKRKVGLDDFNFLAVLGKGNFGKVMLAEERASNSLYAIKVLKKEFIIENDEVESTQSEKRVFLAAAQERHPFLLGLHSCFQTETRVYFVMEYVSGGDLMLHIQRRQFTLRQAKFYACEVLLALQYFHSRGIIYRDLKLDNILLTLDGHVKVADYGLCKEEMYYGSTTSTFCGTPEFMAPEILLEQRYGRAVDWWAFGVLTYEMLLGQSPFRGDDEDEIFDAILEDEPLYPITMPRDAVSLLQKLLTRDPARRLGAGEADAEDIKRHQFFSDVNFDDVYHKRIPPPYFPTIGNATDTSNFDQEFTREQPTLTPVHTQLTAQDQQEFAGFSWIAPWAAAA